MEESKKEPVQGKKKTSKVRKPGQYSAQYYRTAKNIQRRRDRHHKSHPNDKTCLDNWARSPIKTSR